MIYEPTVGKAKEICSVVKRKRYLLCGFNSDMSEYKIMCFFFFSLFQQSFCLRNTHSLSKTKTTFRGCSRWKSLDAPLPA